ncbi:Cytochrome P450 monooxygenase TRI13 [Colletotrichum siamense]|nr:Cytochrome P450 monooxygenase TRI13 [Colletotrichum siamense]
MAYTLAETTGALTAAVVGVVSLLFLIYRWALPKPLPGIPFNKDAAKSILGDAAELQRLQEQGKRPRAWFLQQNIKHKSPLVQAFVAPLSQPMLLLADFREAQDILLRRNKEFDHGERNLAAFRGVLGNHHIGMRTRDPQFKANRELVKDLMTPNFLNTVSAPAIYSNTLRLVELWKLKAKKASGLPFQADKDINMATFDIIKEVALGEGDSENTTEAYIKIIHETAAAKPNTSGEVEFPEQPPDEDLVSHHAHQEAVGASLTAPSPWLYHVINNRRRHMKEAYAIRHRMLENQVSLAVQRLERGQPVRSALDYMIQREMNAAKKAGRSPTFDSSQLRDELYGYIGAGHETTSTSFQWAIKHLTVHQDVQQKLRRALQLAFAESVAQSRQPSVSEITKVDVPYLEAVMEESLRLSGPIMGVVRQAQVETTILGHRVPKGTEVFMPLCGPGITQAPIEVDESLRSETSRSRPNVRGSWDVSPESFIPERWLKPGPNGDEFDPQAGPFMSFSNGVRGCFGRRLAYIEFRILVVLTIWNLELCQVPESLQTFDAVDSLMTKPAKCYINVSKAKN